MKKLLLILPLIILFSSFVSALYSDFAEVTCASGTCNAWENIQFQSLNNTQPEDISDGDDPTVVGGWSGISSPASTYNGAWIKLTSTDEARLSFTYPQTTTDHILCFNFNHTASDCNNGRYWTTRLNDDDENGRFACTNDVSASFIYNNGATRFALATATQGLHRACFWYNTTNNLMHAQMDEDDTVIITGAGTNRFVAGETFSFSAHNLNWIFTNLSYWNYSTHGLDGGDIFSLGAIPPLIDNLVLLSGIDGTNTTIDTTPTLNTTVTDLTGVSMVWIGNYSTITPSNAGDGRKCTKGECISDSTDCTWICTPPTSDQLTNPLVPQPFYLVANDTLGNAHTVFNATMNITLVGGLKGNVTDSLGVAVESAMVTVKLNNSAVVSHNTSSNSTGGWNIDTIAIAGFYTICAYKPSNVTLRGDCTPFIQVP